MQEQPIAPVNSETAEAPAQNRQSSLCRVASHDSTTPATTPPVMQAGRHQVEHIPPAHMCPWYGRPAGGDRAVGIYA